MSGSQVPSTTSSITVAAPTTNRDQVLLNQHMPTKTDIFNELKLSQKERYRGAMNNYKKELKERKKRDRKNPKNF